MKSLIRIQIRDSEGSDTFKAVKIFSDAEVECKADYGTIGEAARANFNYGVKVYRGRNEITQEYAESGRIG